MKKCFLLLLSIFPFGLIGHSQVYDLAIKNAQVFNPKTGIISKNQLILVSADTIAKMANGHIKYNAKNTIDAKGKLVTPSFIDTHFHIGDDFDDGRSLPLNSFKGIPLDSSEFFRKKISDNYLPYGVTTAMSMGDPDSTISALLNWQKNPSPRYADIYFVGTYITSKPMYPFTYIGATLVTSTSEARKAVIDHYGRGIRFLKIHAPINKTDFEAAFKTADSLKMPVFSHLQFSNTSIEYAMKLGEKNFEHIFTIAIASEIWKEKNSVFQQKMDSIYGKGKTPYYMHGLLLEMFREMVDKYPEQLDSLIHQFAQNGVSFSSFTHYLAQFFDLTYFKNSLEFDEPREEPSPIQKQRGLENFKVYMSIIKKMNDRGVKIRIGTDSPNGGKTTLSELLLFCEYGFSVADAIKIATINGAEALQIDNKVGVLEQGKKANMLIWDKNPFDSYKNFLATKIIIKEGVVYNPTN